jgi:penicillin V acylase-like amidase (Ntn superfamily)
MKRGCLNKIMPLYLVLLLLSSISTSVDACTRAVYTGSNNIVMTSRSMDWDENMHSAMWVFPRGAEREGLAGKQSPHWISKYGSVVVSVYDIASADGMNEKGLVMNLLYLAESNYGKLQKGHLPISVSIWGQYVLDNFSSVTEAVESMSQNPFYIIAPNLPNGTASQVHLALSDATGDSAIFEYIDGKLVIHHGKQYQVMTNSPIYSKQLVLDEYWKAIGGTVFLPGTSRAADRFARASFLIHAIPTVISKNYIQGVPEQSYTYQSVASVLSVIRSVSVPLGITTPSEPNIASTLWRTVADQKNRIYYFDSSTYPNTFWVDFNKLNFEAKAPVLMLRVENGEIYGGEVSQKFKPAKPFKFLPASL